VPKDYTDTKESEDAAHASDGSPSLTPEGISAMRGVEPTTSPEDADQIANGVETADLTLDESQASPLDETESPYDDSTLEYRKGSPHDDYDAYKGIVDAERRHEVGQQEATSGDTFEAINATMAASMEAKDSDETPMDEYMREEHGPAPYTEPAYDEAESE
jgi:hypothetical protein